MSAVWQKGSLYLIVFMASACTLILEIVAGRLLAPHLGVSLYTWTTIIGVVLAGISIGNFLGGPACRPLSGAKHPGPLPARQ